MCALEDRFDDVVMGLMSVVMRGTFRKQSLQHLQDFTAFAERGVDVRDG